LTKKAEIMDRPTFEAARRPEGQRLAYYLAAANVEYWDRHWHQNPSPEIYQAAERGDLGKFHDIFTSYLPRKGRILEAGCGPGKYLLALWVLGYEVEGVEWGPETVRVVRGLYPDLPIRLGDVTSLEVPDGYYGGYISIGVVEHRREGPEPFLQEAYRVLRPGGVALISVPHFHPLRRLKAWLRLYRGRTDGLEFYQYAFTTGEFISLLQKAGFKVVDRMVYSGFKGVKDEIPLLRRMFKWRGIGWRLYRRLYFSEWAARNLGHMVLFVCRKTQEIY
jgi:SAM-dependent methyltransferase